ncbi:MAG: Hsp70 family protein, partial [Patescibacteria group bacterium]
VGGQTRMPKIQQVVKDFFGKEPNKTVNPDEVVALGAAIQAAVITGEVKDVLLLDVTPLTLGIETLGGAMTALIERNTTVPTQKSQIFSTAADSQTQVEIHVLQGERPMAVDNKSLGRFVLDGIPPAPRGMPQVEVAFDIDANGILTVSAKDKATGKEQNIVIKNATNLTEEEVEKMRQEAEKYAQEDEVKKAQIESRNKLDGTVFSAEKMLTDNKDKVGEEDKKKVEETVAESKKLLSKEDVTATELDSQAETLSNLIQTIGATIHQQAQPQPESDQPPEEAGEKTDKKKDDGETEEGQIVEE